MERLRRLCRGRTATFGLPLLLYLVVGSFGLREFAQIRYDVQKLHGKVDSSLKEKLKRNNVTLESEYQRAPRLTLKYMGVTESRPVKLEELPVVQQKLEKSDLDNWENIRGPRLWEDSKTVQKQQREAARLKRE